jgi:RimJ/RimL family protein N-acetyltransferase
MDIATVRSARLVGHEFHEGDFEDYARLFGDPRVGASLGGVLSLDDARARFEVGRAHWRAHGFGPWSWRDGDGAYVGRGGLRHCIARGRAEIELAYSIVPAQWQRGYATEIAQASAEIAFAALGLVEIVAFTYTDNLKSQRVLVKSGFVADGEEDRHGERHIFYRLRKGG